MCSAEGTLETQGLYIGISGDALFAVADEKDPLRARVIRVSALECERRETVHHLLQKFSKWTAHEHCGSYKYVKPRYPGKSDNTVLENEWTAGAFSGIAAGSVLFVALFAAVAALNSTKKKEPVPSVVSLIENDCNTATFENPTFQHVVSEHNNIL